MAGSIKTKKITRKTCLQMTMKTVKNKKFQRDKELQNSRKMVKVKLLNLKALEAGEVTSQATRKEHGTIRTKCRSGVCLQVTLRGLQLKRKNELL